MLTSSQFEMPLNDIRERRTEQEPSQWIAAGAAAADVLSRLRTADGRALSQKRRAGSRYRLSRG